MTRPCERCGGMPPRITVGPWAGQLHAHNYCKHCSKDLCEKCLAEGRCKESPRKKHEVENDDL